MSDSPHTHCTEHSGLMSRMNLTVGLLGLVLTGIISLYVTIGGQLRELDKAVAVTAQRSEAVAKSLEHAWDRIDRLEGVK